MNALKCDEESIYHEARNIDDPTVRASFIEQVCAGDHALRGRVERLLRISEREASFLEASPCTIDLESPELIERPGSVIGPYTLREQVGEGGMGSVFVAEQSQPVRRKVALKIIKPGMDTKQVIARFEAERQALAVMDHPNIARVFDGGATASGRPYFVMELLRGIPITEYCDREKLSITERLDLFVLVCRAVQHAHQKGVIHRDLKPSNILVTVIDGVAVPKVIDFGVAKATGAALTDRTLYTAFQQFIGTPLYMSPEQADLSGVDVDTRGDIYSLGVLLYELLTGTTPFDSETFRTAAFDEMRRIIREDEPPRPSTRLSSLGASVTTVSSNRKADVRHLNRTVRGELDWIVMKALEKDRARRYESANDFAADVTRYLTDQPVQAGPPSAAYRLRKFLRRNKGTVATGLALTALLLLGTVGTSIGLVRALRAERAATREKDRAAAAATEAKEEAAIATAVSNFLTDDLLAEAKPEQNPRDQKVTVEELLGRAADRIADKFAKQPRVEARIRLAIGEAYAALGEFTAAQPHLERAWELTRREFGPEHPDALHVMNRLGDLYIGQGELAKAREVLTRALDISHRVLGEDHRETIDALTSLALACKEQGDGEKAESLYVRALEASRHALGEEHTVTVRCMDNLATLYVGLGRLAEAEPLLVKALEVTRRDLGEMDPGTLTCMGNLAGLYWSMGKFKLSVPLYEDVLKRQQAVLGPDHPTTLVTMANVGVNHRDAGDLQKGIAYLDQAWALARKRPGTLGEDLGWIRVVLAETYDRAGEFTRAEPLARQALDHALKQFGADSPQTATALDCLGPILLHLRKDAESERLLRQCLELREEHDAESWVTSSTRSMLGDSLLGQKKYAEAEPLLLSGYEGLKRHEETIPPVGKGLVTEAGERLVRLYEAMDKKDEAEAWRAKLPAPEAAKSATKRDD